MILQQRIPGQLVIQLTDQCNARCPQCGMRVTAPFSRSILSTDDVKRMLAGAAEKRFQAVSFTGGEPLIHLKKLTELIRCSGDLGIPLIRTGTNGFIFRNPHRPGFTRRIARIADALADTPLRNFWISIDSMIPEVHEEMRGFKGVIAGIEKALPIFHARGLYPSANLGINRNLGGALTRGLRAADYGSQSAYHAEFYRRYRAAFRAYYRFIISLGFTIVNTCYPMSLGTAEKKSGLEPVYAATAVEDIVRYTNQEKRALFKALGETIQKFRSRIRIFSPQCALHALEKRYAGKTDQTYPCRGGIDFFFIDAKTGNTFPCGYRGRENLGKLHSLDMKTRDRDQRCDLCDWECFRDPSDLFGPILNGLSHPIREIKRAAAFPRFYRLWARDLLYYQACGFFNGRTPMRRELLSLF